MDFTMWPPWLTHICIAGFAFIALFNLLPSAFGHRLNKRKRTLGTYLALSILSLTILYVVMQRIF
jgi:hypothetical protein